MTDGIPIAGGQVARQIDEVNTTCQIIRSSAAWSAGLKSIENQWKIWIKVSSDFVYATLNELQQIEVC